MARFPTSGDNSHLWGFNPQSNQLYTTAERRNAMRLSNRGGVLPDSRWDKFYDAQHKNRVAQTLGLDPVDNPAFSQQLSALAAQPGMNEELLGELSGQKIRMNVGASPEGSNQLRGHSVQPGSSLSGLRQAASGRGSSMDTDDMIDQSQSNRQQGGRVRTRSGGVLGRQETGRF